jgi:hypothetical protein
VFEGLSGIERERLLVLGVVPEVSLLEWLFVLLGSWERVRQVLGDVEIEAREVSSSGSN